MLFCNELALMIVVMAAMMRMMVETMMMKNEESQQLLGRGTLISQQNHHSCRFTGLVSRGSKDHGNAAFNSCHDHAPWHSRRGGDGIPPEAVERWSWRAD